MTVLEYSSEACIWGFVRACVRACMRARVCGVCDCDKASECWSESIKGRGEGQIQA